jgi:rhodanese-related sulfurtransferase
MIQNVTPKQAWQALLAEPDTRLVDVRTPAEWRTIGVPDLGQADKQVLLVSWQDQAGRVNPDFIAELREAGLAPGHRLLFLCRSGVRSLAAAQQASQAGFVACLNVADGFEGPPDPTGRRGHVSGWQAEGLPWSR